MKNEKWATCTCKVHAINNLYIHATDSSHSCCRSCTSVRLLEYIYT